jgi:predicted alpha/beta hydrolase family esterase
MNVDSARAAAPGLLVIPGLHDSPPGHWQSWLQSLHRRAVRVSQHDGSTPDLARWSARMASVVDRSGPGPFPYARRWLLAHEQRLARLRRPDRASILE